MGDRNITLEDRFDLMASPVLLSGTQALVRLVLMQAARDRAAGLDTAGYVTGYRGSPLGAVDMQMTRAARELSEARIIFQPGMNEDLAATALWGTQQAELRGEGRHDGVFGLWYGKGPGVDRSGDVMRHANMAGTSRHGGVVMAMGDDHTGESSTVCHQSDFAMVDAQMPILSPAGVQEILDYGLYAYALSRFAGVWCGLKLMKDTVEVTSVVDGALDRMHFVTPDFDMPDGGLNIRLGDHWIAQEARMIQHKRLAAEAFAHANRIDRRGVGKPGARIGFVAAGKNWLDLCHALDLLGIDADEAVRLGLTTYKIGQTFPLDMKGFHDWAEGLDLIVVVEEKRKLIEGQIKEALFDDRRGRRVYGWHKGGAGSLHRQELFPVEMSIDPVLVAARIGHILVEEGRGSERVKFALQELDKTMDHGEDPDIASRLPYFCAGCPHNASTKLPEGSRAYAGIGCHIMALWMDRETSGFTHMGGEGANWIGEAPFSTRAHVFQNIGDGTYNHSGLLAIRAAVAAGATMTYKILYNDAVAMTGGQGNDGGLGPDRIVRELLAMGVREVAVVFDEKEEPDRAAFPAGIGWHPRAELEQVQKKIREIKGVTAIVYVQTCAAEKRRRRKRSQFADPDRRVFINPDICEGCGDCGVQSNCVAILPKETEFGRKRVIDQSACNKDYRCLNGFCPSFVTLTGASPRKDSGTDLALPDLPAPDLPDINGTHNVVITGVGGTGVVTIGAVLAQAAQIDGKGAGMMEMAGMAQKGGAVHIHCRLAHRPEDIRAIRVAAGEADLLIGGDLVVSAGGKTLGLLRPGRTGAVVNSHETMTGDFTRDTDFRIPGKDLSGALGQRIGGALRLFDASELARSTMGDAIYANMILLGAAWQGGLLPLRRAALTEAITLNGAAVTQNLRAFEIGRWATVCPQQAQAQIAGDAAHEPLTDAARIALRAEHLAAYQGKRLARRYTRMLNGIEDDALRLAVAKGYHKLLSYKDEYEVARLHLQTADKALDAFDGEFGMQFHLAPPLLARKGPDGRPQKRAFGAWILRPLRVLARLRFLRGTPFDPFGYTAERRMERALIRDYERDMAALLPKVDADTRDAILELAELPLAIRGFGPVKAANAEKAAAKRKQLREVIRAGGVPLGQAAE